MPKSAGPSGKKTPPSQRDSVGLGLTITSSLPARPSLNEPRLTEDALFDMELEQNVGQLRISQPEPYVAT